MRNRLSALCKIMVFSLLSISSLASAAEESRLLTVLNDVAIELAPILAKRVGESLYALTHPNGPLGCSNPESYNKHLMAAFARNDHKACLAATDRCEKENPSLFDQSPLSSLWAGDCALGNFDRRRAVRFYDRARDRKNAAIAEFPYLILRSLREIYDRPFSDRAEAILSKGPWPSEQRALILGLIREDTALSQAIEAFVEGEIKNENLHPLYRAELLRLLIEYFSNTFQFRKSLALAGENLDLLGLTSNVFRSAASLYFALAADEELPLSLARDLYKEMLPYMGPESWFPKENNSYTYTELYDEVCKDQLLPEERVPDLLAIGDAWHLGTQSAEEALASVIALEIAFPARADVLTLRGAILLSMGAWDEARDAFWKAHQACHFYNKAHWGLAAIFDRRIWIAREDHASELAELKTWIFVPSSIPALLTSTHFPLLILTSWKCAPSTATALNL